MSRAMEIVCGDCGERMDYRVTLDGGGAVLLTTSKPCKCRKKVDQTGPANVLSIIRKTVKARKGQATTTVVEEIVERERLAALARSRLSHILGIADSSSWHNVLTEIGSVMDRIGKIQEPEVRLAEQENRIEEPRKRTSAQVRRRPISASPTRASST